MTYVINFDLFALPESPTSQKLSGILTSRKSFAIASTVHNPGMARPPIRLTMSNKPTARLPWAKFPMKIRRCM
jgi:hypothetical protein